MSTQHPITPPGELVRQWLEEKPVDEYAHHYLATQAARWGSDQELEACCEWLTKYRKGFLGADLRFVRRPKPPNLNSIALQMLGTIERDAHYLPEITDTIRKALEALDD